MDENGDNIPRPESPFSFQRLLCGDDWQRWDTFPTVDANTNSSDVTVESDGPNPLLMTLGMEETVEQWIQYEQFETSSQEEDLEMSFDVDTFTYEELLELGEQIGDVSTGLNVETIDEKISRRKYEDSRGQAEKCMICLYELKCNEEASKLGCGHDFHFGCIKKWLVVKNMCPLCKQGVI